MWSQFKSDPLHFVSPEKQGIESGFGPQHFPPPFCEHMEQGH